MGRRGPKPRNAGNSGNPGGAKGPARVDPPSELTPAAEAEFRRLVDVLDARGSLGRVDLAVVAEAARVKALLDRAHDVADVTDPATIKVLNVLTTQRRGLLRELGLTLQPSRSVVRTDARSTDAEEDPVRKHLRIRG
jgi:phage terminase small subunit